MTKHKQVKIEIYKNGFAKVTECPEGIEILFTDYSSGNYPPKGWIIDSKNMETQK